MNYTLHSEPQGTEAWLAGRNTRLNASDLVRAAGTSMNGKTRTDLIRKLATGIEPDVDAETQRRFDDGHRFEALARPIMEQIIGRDLYPITASIAVDGLSRRLGASLDGATDDDSINAEHKGMNAELRDSLSRGIIPPEYHWQMEQGQMVNGATRTLFMASKWEKVSFDEIDDGKVYGFAMDEDGYEARYLLVEELHAWYESNPELRAKIIPIWRQFEADVENYQHVEAAPVAVAAPIKDLPAIIITSTGSLTVETNFAAWGKSLREFIDKIPEKPSTDQEFADCKAAVAALKKAEEMLDAEEARVLSAIPDVDEMKRDKKLLWELSSTTRLALEKLVVQRDKDVKIEITQAGKDALAEHITGLNKRLATVQMPTIAADFVAAIKNKRSYDKMREAVADLVATKKIESSGIADKIDANLKLLDAAKEHDFLFHDRATLAMKDAETLALYIKSRITEHQAIEAKRLEAIKEAARIEAEKNAAAKVKAEADAKAKAEQEAVDAQRKAGEEAAAKIERDRVATPTATAADRVGAMISGSPETAAPAAPGASSPRLDETPKAAAPTHSGMTGSARLLDRLDDLARQMTEAELSDLCIHAAHIIENRRAAA